MSLSPAETATPTGTESVPSGLVLSRFVSLNNCAFKRREDSAKASCARSADIVSPIQAFNLGKSLRGKGAWSQAQVGPWCPSEGPWRSLLCPTSAGWNCQQCPVSGRPHSLPSAAKAHDYVSFMLVSLALDCFYSENAGFRVVRLVSSGNTEKQTLKS